MCLNGQPPYIQPYKVVTIGTEHKIQWASEGLSPWPKANQESLSNQELMKLFDALVGAIDACRSWLLDFGRLDLSLQNLKIDPNGSVLFAYSPFEEATNKDHHEALTRLLQGLYGITDDQCEASIGLLHRIGIALSEDPFNLKDFAGQVRQALEENN